MGDEVTKKDLQSLQGYCNKQIADMEKRLQGYCDKQIADMEKKLRDSLDCESRVRSANHDLHTKAINDLRVAINGLAGFATKSG
jgi:hypothetical protein